ncbi:MULTISPECIES: ABC transporter substrate-binding protein [Paraburkholderia]|jgi:polar amino acid transport system substrate-binding protein|uniref:Amino acid ABC transporter substrate-binding protein, PAAT family n=1 Tax=Paraburkholderia phenazinium TaxID=60549 RepID=A0A1N6KKG1_9BURK|nr:ABC transporter substrate-binding protein [Paraburkholderia phenazinium]SIO57041.1 amino acid ABC transporter substrate-binding protein, PAAT family [Paraburkholderia phenazinium]
MIPLVKRLAGAATGLAIALSCVIAVAAIAVAAEQPAYTVGATATGVPFTFLDVKTGSIQGMMVDAITAAGKEGGFQVSVQQTTFSALIPSLTTKKIDIISAAMLKTPARQQVVDFSDTVYSYGEGLMVKADDTGHYTSMDDLKGEVVGAQVGTAFVDALNKRGIFKEVRTYDSVADIMRDVALGRIKAGFGDQPIIAYQLEHGANPQVKLVKEYQPDVKGQVCFVVRKGDSATLEMLNQAIKKMKADGSLQQVLQKWHME